MFLYEALAVVGLYRIPAFYRLLKPTKEYKTTNISHYASVLTYHDYIVVLSQKVLSNAKKLLILFLRLDGKLMYVNVSWKQDVQIVVHCLASVVFIMKILD